MFFLIRSDEREQEHRLFGKEKFERFAERLNRQLMSFHKAIIRSMRLGDETDEEVQKALIAMVYVGDAARLLGEGREERILAKCVMLMQNSLARFGSYGALIHGSHAMRQKAVRIAEKVGHEQEERSERAAELHGWMWILGLEI